MHKLHIQCPKIVFGGWQKKGEGRRENGGGGKSAMVVVGIDAPD